jgi:hypothetical protein
MIFERKNNIPGLKLNRTAFMLFLILQLFVQNASAQSEKVATLKLDFIKSDSTKTCKATLISDSLPVKGVEVHLYAKRLYTLLPVDKVVATDENGEASFNFPMDLPGDKNNTITVIAKVEKNETYGNVETLAEVKWGVVSKSESYNWSNRSLSASREKAPMFLVVASTLIILVIWGTILFIIFQLVRIKKSVRQIKKIIIPET